MRVVNNVHIQPRGTQLGGGSVLSPIYVRGRHALRMRAAAVYHAATWFNATQKAMPIQIGEDFVPGNLISGAHYAAWAVLSVVVLFVAGVF